MVIPLVVATVETLGVNDAGGDPAFVVDAQAPSEQAATRAPATEMTWTHGRFIPKTLLRPAAADSRATNLGVWS
jgi:hypothetical protein